MIAANQWGKAKTISQIVAILLVVVLQYGNELISLGILPLAMEEAQIFSQVALVVGQIATWICVLFTLISGAIYLWDNREFVKTAK